MNMQIIAFNDNERCLYGNGVGFEDAYNAFIESLNRAALSETEEMDVMFILGVLVSNNNHSAEGCCNNWHMRLNFSNEL